MPNDSLLVMETFERLKGKMNRLVEPLAQAEGLTFLQGYVLAMLGQGEMSVGALSSRTKMGQANTSTLCKKLEQAGYLIRTRSSRDERTVLLSLTERGRAAQEHMQMGMKRYQQALETFSPELMAELLRGVRAADLMMDYLLNQNEGAKNHAEAIQYPQELSNGGQHGGGPPGDRSGISGE